MFTVITVNFSAKCDDWLDAKKLCDAIHQPAIVHDADGELCSIHNMTLDTALEDAGFCVRTYNVLKRAGVETIGDAFHKYRLRWVRNLGRKSLQEIRAYAEMMGETLWSDKLDLIDSAIYGLEAFADKRGKSIDENERYKNLCADVTDWELDGDYMDFGYIAGEIATIKQELGL